MSSNRQPPYSSSFRTFDPYPWGQAPGSSGSATYSSEDELAEGPAFYQHGPQQGVNWTEDDDIAESEEDEGRESDSASVDSRRLFTHSKSIQRQQRQHFPPPRTHSAQQVYRHSSPTPPDSMSANDPWGPYSQGHYGHQGRASYYGGPAGGRGQQQHIGYNQSHAGDYGQSPYGNQVVPYGGYNNNPFSPAAPMGAGGGYFGNDHRGWGNEMMPYGGHGSHYFAGGPGGYQGGMHMQPYWSPPPPPPTEPRGTPAPKEEPPKPDPEKEELKNTIKAIREAQEAAKALEVAKAREAQIKAEAEEAFKKKMEDMAREERARQEEREIALEKAKKEIEEAKKEAARAAKEAVEAERKAEAERAKVAAELAAKAERDARDRLEAERRAEEARAKAAAEAMAKAEREARDKLEAERKAAEEAAKEAAKAAAEAAIKAEREAREKFEAEVKAEAERARLAAEAMAKAEREARDKLEAERKAAEEAAKAAAEAVAKAEREAREKFEAERKAAEEAAKAAAEAVAKAEREARDKIEAERKAEEERKKKEAEAAAIADAAAQRRLEAAIKAKEEAEAAAKKKADEEAEWKKLLEQEAKMKAEMEARAKIEAEKKKAEEEEAAAAAKKQEEEAFKKKALEEAKEKADEANKKSQGKDKSPIRFKDAVGRKFSFPFHLCQTWGGMEELIKQAFLHVDRIGPHVQAGHYDLLGPDGEIILPQVWDKVIEPDWAITMHMWPMDSQPRPGVSNRPPFMGTAARPAGPAPGPPPGVHLPGMEPRPGMTPRMQGAIPVPPHPDIRGPAVPPQGHREQGMPMPMHSRHPNPRIVEVERRTVKKKTGKEPHPVWLGYLSGSKPKKKK